MVDNWWEGGGEEGGNWTMEGEEVGEWGFEEGE